MPTPSDGPSAALVEKILPEMLILAAESGWTDANFRLALKNQGVDPGQASAALPDGVGSLIVFLFDRSLSTLDTELAALDLTSMRIRDKVTSGVRIWLETLSGDHQASVRALDWVTARFTGPLPVTELIWKVADHVWTGIGDDATGFSYMSKRTILAGVISSTLAVWRKSAGEEAEWSAFLDRRIGDVMSFEKFKARFRPSVPA